MGNIHSSLFKPKKMVRIDVTENWGWTFIVRVDFKEIDTSIKRIPNEGPGCTNRVTIEFPEDQKEEIIEKLKAHKNIGSVNGEMTASGIENERIREAQWAEREANAKPCKLPSNVIVVSATEPVIFQEIDRAIIKITPWSQQEPTFASVQVPKDRVDEMIEKLKAHPKITSVNGVKTALGLEIDPASFGRSITCDENAGLSGLYRAY